MKVKRKSRRMRQLARLETVSKPDRAIIEKKEDDVVNFCVNQECN